MKKKYTTHFSMLLWATVVLPQVSFAAFDAIKTLLKDFKSILDLLVPIIFGLAVLFFFWGVAQFIRTVSEKTKEEGKNKMIWGIVALFVMFSIWGIIKYIGDTVGIDTGIKSSTSSSSGPCTPDPFSGNPCP
ncbi:MAG: hypothetical protein RL292_472 [Candidatus Parcubacteria bacterium]|jgi:uncharacterized membrane protein YidH (DUF202 family)